MPALEHWDKQGLELRQITEEHIRATLDEVAATTVMGVHAAVRSLFRAARRERRVFRDPARKVSLPSNPKLPRPLPSDRLTGLLERAGSPAAKLAVALVAVHALTPKQIRLARLDHFDRSAARLTVTHGRGERTVFLDDVSLRLAVALLRERARRWPLTANPHLILSQ